MKKQGAVAGFAVGLLALAGCSRGDADRARSESRDAQEKAQRQLEVTKDKLRQELRRADDQTREDLDKARTQVRQALRQAESDAEKARDKLRDRANNPDSNDSHQ